MGVIVSLSGAIDLPGFRYSVTSVGATNNIDEVGTFFSGGGFSDYFPRPSYQDKAVEAYLKKLPEGLYKGLYNPYVAFPLSNYSYVLCSDTSFPRGPRHGRVSRSILSFRSRIAFLTGDSVNPAVTFCRESLMSPHYRSDTDFSGRGMPVLEQVLRQRRLSWPR